MSEYHQPHETASLLGLTPATLRRWCEYHKDYLSPDTQPSAGQSRRFTNRDIEVLRHCKHLRAQGLTVTSINEQLATLTFPEVEPNQAIEPVHDDQPDELVTAVTAPQNEQFTRADIQFIELLSSRVAALERSYKVGVFYGFGLGFIAACGVFLLILVVAVLYGGFR